MVQPRCLMLSEWHAAHDASNIWIVMWRVKKGLTFGVLSIVSKWVSGLT